MPQNDIEDFKANFARTPQVLAMDYKFVTNLMSDRQSFSMMDMFETKKSIYSKVGDTAEISISGALNVNSFFGNSLDYSEIDSAIKEAMADDEIKSVKFFMDSPGGSVVGLKETADRLAELSKVKNTETFVKGLCCSACYWLATQTNKITALTHSPVGSIGVYNLFVDSSEAYKKEGYEAVLIASGKEKGQPMDGVKISQEVLDREQKEVDAIAEQFYTAVKTKRPQTANADIFQGACFMGEEALRLGLIDCIGDVDFINDFSSEDKHMEETNEEVKVEKIDIDQVKAEAGAEATENTYKLLNDLKEAFPEHQAFVFEQFEKKATIEEARAEFIGVLQAENKALKEAKPESVAVVETKVEAKVGGVAPIEFNQAEAGNKDFKSLVEDEVNASKCSWADGVRKVYANNPSMYQGRVQ